MFYLNDLEELSNILDTLVFEDEPSIFTDETAVDLVQTALHLMDEFMKEDPQLILDPNFYDILLEEIKDLLYVQMEDHISEDDEEDMNEILEDAFQIFITLFYPERSTNINTECSLITNHEDLEYIEQKIQGLRNIPQPVQRTPEWYTFRSNLITASNAWKAFESQAAINQLIYEKCQPAKIIDPDVKVIHNVNTNTPMHNGQKYEPLSVMFYEYMYHTIVEDFGCIQHPLYSFLGASPDGINVDPKSERYGRMLEIKNPVSRDITGIPKKEYWVQMQLQMEVCDLDECDFLETKFVEYSDRISYEADTTFGKDKKGVIIQFYTKEGIPFYAYKPLHLISDEGVSQWEDETITFYESEPYHYNFTKYIYWRLEQLSCILVLRNRTWFSNNIGQLENVWKIIEKERVTGFEHRAPGKTSSKSSSLEPKQNSSEINFFEFIKNKK